MTATSILYIKPFRGQNYDIVHLIRAKYHCPIAEVNYESLVWKIKRIGAFANLLQVAGGAGQIFPLKAYHRRPRPKQSRPSLTAWHFVLVLANNRNPSRLWQFEKMTTLKLADYMKKNEVCAAYTILKHLRPRNKSEESIIFSNPDHTKTTADRWKLNGAYLTTFLYVYG